jgi:predicted branched-subunit amino acid permease
MAEAGLPRLVWIVPSVMLIVALAKLPYDYYTLLRLVVTICALVIAAEIYRREAISIWLCVFAALALLFNPVFPVHLTRAIWAPIDIGCALIFLAHMYFERERKWLSAGQHAN